MIRKGDLVENQSIIIPVIGRPAAVRALHGQRPCTPPPNDLVSVRGLKRRELGQSRHHCGTIINVGVPFIFKLKIPSAGLGPGSGHDPITDPLRLPGPKPGRGTTKRLMVSGKTFFSQHVHDQRRIPHRGMARLQVKSRRDVSVG